MAPHLVQSNLRSARRVPRAVRGRPQVLAELCRYGGPARHELKKLVSPSPTGYGDSTVTEIHKSGTVLKGIELTGSVDVWANNVTIENSVIYARSWWGINLRHGYHGLRVLHCTIIGLPGQGPDNGAEDYGVSSSGSYIEVGWSNLSASVTRFPWASAMYMTTTSMTSGGSFRPVPVPTITMTHLSQTARTISLSSITRF